MEKNSPPNQLIWRVIVIYGDLFSQEVSLWGTLSNGCIIPYMPLNLAVLHSNSLFLPIYPCICPANWIEIWRIGKPISLKNPPTQHSE